MPVVTVHHVGRPVRKPTVRDFGRDLTQGSKPFRVIGPVFAVRAKINAAFTVKKMRRLF